MAEDAFDSSYHVPQQSRRDKLRVLPHLPYYDPPPPNPADPFCFPSSSSDPLVKEEPPSNLLKFVGDSLHPLHPPSSNPSSSIHEGYPPLFCTSTSHDLGYPPYASVDSSVCNNARGLSLSLWSRMSGGDDQGSVSLPMSIPIHLPPPPELNLERYGSAQGFRDGGGGCFREVAVGPMGPFTGYSLVLRGSRFLKPAQQLLEELCGAASAERVSASDSSFVVGFGEGFRDAGEHCGVGGEKKSRLKSLLEEVCRRYKQYCQQLQHVVASFECVPGLGNAAPYVNLALKVMSKHFRYLKDAIMEQFQFTMKTVRNTTVDLPRFETDERTQFGQRGIQQNAGFLEHQPVWRPQRGLPERAVTVLRAWLFDHFLHPYPTDNDKLMLAKETGLSRSQVSNWFINARVRLWKPMVEEIHMLETQQTQKTSHTQPRDERNPTQTSNDLFPPSSSVPSTSTPGLHSTHATRTAGDPPANGSSLWNKQTRHLPHMDTESTGRAKPSSVALTLGLHHQNSNVTSTSAGFPMGAAQERLGLGLETIGERRAIAGTYGTQEQHLERDAYGDNVQLLRDFAG